MYTVSLEKQCGCVKRNNMPLQKHFMNKDEALIEANSWSREMNETFCQKHDFSVVEENGQFVIRVLQRS